MATGPGARTIAAVGHVRPAANVARYPASDNRAAKEARCMAHFPLDGLAGARIEPTQTAASRDGAGVRRRAPHGDRAHLGHRRVGGPGGGEVGADDCVRRSISDLSCAPDRE